MGHCKFRQNPQRRSDHVFPAYEAAAACLEGTTPAASSLTHPPPPSLGNTRLTSWAGKGFIRGHLCSALCVGARGREKVSNLRVTSNFTNVSLGQSDFPLKASNKPRSYIQLRGKYLISVDREAFDFPLNLTVQEKKKSNSLANIRVQMNLSTKQK